MAIVFDSDAGTITGLSVGGLPDGIVDSGTLATNSVDSAELVDGAITGADLPAGSVLQVVNHRSTAFNTATSSQTYVSSGIAASITPSSTSSKIWVGVTLNGLYKSGANNSVSTKLYRGSTDLGQIDSMGTYTNSTDSAVGNTSIGYLDSPNSSSAVEYKIYFASISGAAVLINARYNASFTTHSTITLMEIAG